MLCKLRGLELEIAGEEFFDGTGRPKNHDACVGYRLVVAV